MRTMKLTPDERKLLAQLRRTESEMFRSRHLLMAVGISSLLVAGAGALLLLYWLSRTPEVAQGLYTLLFPAVLLLAIHGTYILAIAIRDRNGNAVRVLLLKLIDEQLKTDGDGRNPPPWATGPARWS